MKMINKNNLVFGNNIARKRIRGGEKEKSIFYIQRVPYARKYSTIYRNTEQISLGLGIEIQRRLEKAYISFLY